MSMSIREAIAYAVVAMILTGPVILGYVESRIAQKGPRSGPSPGPK